MTQENVNVDVSISMDDIRTVLNRDAKFALQVQNAALNMSARESRVFSPDYIPSTVVVTCEVVKVPVA